MRTPDQILDQIREECSAPLKDNEAFHSEMDNLICEYLLAIGHTEAGTLFKEARSEFWYA